MSKLLIGIMVGTWVLCVLGIVDAVLGGERTIGILWGIIAMWVGSTWIWHYLATGRTK